MPKWVRYVCMHWYGVSILVLYTGPEYVDPLFNLTTRTEGLGWFGRTNFVGSILVLLRTAQSLVHPLFTPIDVKMSNNLVIRTLFRFFLARPTCFYYHKKTIYLDPKVRTMYVNLWFVSYFFVDPFSYAFILHFLTIFHSRNMLRSLPPFFSFCVSRLLSSFLLLLFFCRWYEIEITVAFAQICYSD